MNTCLNENDRSGRRGGFTVVEILVAITVIAILAAMLIPVVGSAMRRAKEFAIQSEMAQLDLAIEHFKSDHGFYPPSFNGLDSVTFMSYLNRMAPNHAYSQADINNWWTNYGGEIAELPGADLVFWLSGIAKNKQYPLGDTSTGWLAGHNFHPGDNQVFERNVYYDFNSERLNFCHFDPANPGSLDTHEPASFVQAQGKLFDEDLANVYPNEPWKWAAVYLYLDADNYGNAGGYRDAGGFYNQDSFQLFAPGLDGKKGQVNVTGTFVNQCGPDGLDNIVNFVGDGTGKLETKALGID